MRFLQHFLSAGLLFCSFNACSPTISNDARPAYDAYVEFVAELRACSDDRIDPKGRECDKEKIWNGLDAQTKSRFLEAYGALVRIDRIIETYFDNIEHKSMRARTGTDILAAGNIKEYKDLFMYMFKPESLVIDSGTDSGLVLAESHVNSSDYVTIQTHANGQVFPMILEDDGVWRTAGLLDAVERAIEPIMASETAMREYAKGNLKTELERREKVREYFLIQQEIQRINLLKVQGHAGSGDTLENQDVIPAPTEVPGSEPNSPGNDPVAVETDDAKVPDAAPKEASD